MAPAFRTKYQTHQLQSRSYALPRSHSPAFVTLWHFMLATTSDGVGECAADGHRQNYRALFLWRFFDSIFFVLGVASEGEICYNTGVDF